jgi:PIN domain nuclease of toxin-antitoxin system
MLLRDPPAFLWGLADDPALRPATRAAMAAGQPPVCVRAASAWDMRSKRAQGTRDSPDDLEAERVRHRFQALLITVAHTLRAGRQPRHHGDPFDRRLSAQAQRHRLTAVTHDPRFALYGVPMLWTCAAAVAARAWSRRSSRWHAGRATR